MPAMRNVVILISGRGSNMQAIVRAAQTEQWPARIAAIISNEPEAEGLAFAAEHGIPAIAVPHKDYPTRDAFDAALQAAIDSYSPDLVVLAGFMRILGASMVSRYAGRMMNIHPSLLPSFPGMHTHREALATGVKIHGATVHFVTATLDSGPIVEQAAVPVMSDDTEQTLAARVLEQEHIIYPRAVRWFVEGRLLIADGRVLIDQAA
ncbi:phosphoribosylglycinamide formyltransferase [soil metagenome]